MTARHLADVLPSALAAIGAPLPGTGDRLLPLAPAQSAVVVLVDGLGARLMDARADMAPMLSACERFEVSAGFPTTTSAGLGALGTGLPAGGHGLVAASFWIPECDRMLYPLRWGGEPAAYVVSPEPSVFERAASMGVKVAAVSPRAYADSGLTASVLRGASYVGADSLGERVEETARAAREPRSLTYVYWGELDRTGHVHGWQSDHWAQELRTVDHFIARLRESLPPATALLVTADHGMVDAGTRIDIDDAVLHADVLRVGGEPRCRHLYTRPGAAGDVALRWSEELGDAVEVRERRDAVREWYAGADAYSDRVGDVVVIARGDVVLTSDRTDRLVSSLIGQHGSVSEDESVVPVLDVR